MFENLNKEENVVYYAPGQLVQLRHKELNSPVMLITEKVTKQFKNTENELTSFFVGMRTIWFDKNNCLQTGVFSTKDLELYNK